MDLDSAVAEFEAIVSGQARLGGEEVDEAAEALLTAARPGLERLAFRLAEQAAVEVSAQLPEATVEVVVSEGEPTLAVRSSSSAETKRFSGEDLEARLTLRLPAELKEQVENCAQESGDSVNSFVVHSLMGAARR
ncbi:MAG: Arc family DNA-binding protein, partial [Acidimicrobiia bacterium]|nr:Arc family DNA-binding protein [Acidimicrobiia bacterium]